MEVRVLGPLRVEPGPGPGEGGTPPRGARPRDVLAVLLTRRGRPVPAETVLDLVWRDEAAGLGPAAVHTVVARLRRQFGAGLVATSPAGYLVPAAVAVDAETFAGIAAQAHETPSGPERERLCRAALALWSGDSAYHDVDAELVLPERVRLDELGRRVRGELAASLLVQGSRAAAAEAFDLARGLIAGNPLDEAASVLAIRAAYRLGRQGEALETYERLRRTLAEELGIGPGPSVAAVHAQVLAQDATLDAREARPLHVGRAVPRPSSPTVGRAAETTALLDALRSGRRLVTVTGPGGVGKTRLLAEVSADRLLGEAVHISLFGRDGVKPGELAAGLAVTAGVPLTGEDGTVALVEALATAELTVFVDEAERSVDAVADLVSAVLAGCPGVRVVVGSRVPLQVVGERVLELAPLAVADPAADLDGIRASAAVQLLAERLVDRAVAPAVPLHRWPEADLRAVAEVADRLDGLPLALELAAGAAGAGTVRDLPGLVQRPLDLETGERGRDDRQQSLRRTISWSVARLDPPAREVFRALAVFEGAFSAAAARAVAGEGADAAVRTLATHHLLNVERNAGRLGLRMLCTVRDLALEELAAGGRRSIVQARHQWWFAGLWRDAPLSDELVEHVGRTYDDHLAALSGALDSGADAVAADIALALSRRWLFVETPQPARYWITRLLERPGLPARQRAKLVMVRAALLQRGLADGELPGLLEALADDPDWACQLRMLAAITAYQQGDPAAALEHVDHGLDLARRAPWLMPEMIAVRAVLDAFDGRTAEAVAGAHQALAHAGTAPSAIYLVTVVPKVALALLDAGRPAEAYEQLTGAAAQTQALFGVRPTVTVTVNAGWAALALGRPADAAGWFAEGLVGTWAAVSPGVSGEASTGCGAALAALGRPGAGELIGLGRRLLRDAGHVLTPSMAEHVDGAAARVGDPEPPSAWTQAMVQARVAQLVRAGLPAG